MQPRQVKLLYVRNTKHTNLYPKWFIIFDFNNKELAFFNQLGSSRNVYHSFNSIRIFRMSARIRQVLLLVSIKSRLLELADSTLFIDNKRLHNNIFRSNFRWWLLCQINLRV